MRKEGRAKRQPTALGLKMEEGHRDEPRQHLDSISKPEVNLSLAAFRKKYSLSSVRATSDLGHRERRTLTDTHADRLWP